jgi:UPF0716 family protein affecting phage T7 exclusion
LKRGILFAASIILIIPEWMTDIIGMFLLIIIASIQLIKSRASQYSNNDSEIEI